VSAVSHGTVLGQEEAGALEVDREIARLKSKTMRGLAASRLAELGDPKSIKPLIRALKQSASQTDWRGMLSTENQSV